MEQAGTQERQKVDYIAEIYNLCTTISEEAIASAEAKARENKFDVDRGEITFAELSNNLASAREVLKDAIEKRKLIQLPLTVQKLLLANFQSVSKSLQGLMSNTDEIVNLGNSVEVLNTSIWQYGLHNLSEQVLGYQTKINQLKQQEVRTKELIALLNEGVSASERIQPLLKTSIEEREKIEANRQAVDQALAAVSQAQEEVVDKLGKVSQSLAAAQQSELQAAQALSGAKSAVADITPLEESVKKFFSEVDEYRRLITASTADASKFLTESNTLLAKEVSEAKVKVAAELDRLSLTAKSSSEAHARDLLNQLQSNKILVSELTNEFTKKEDARFSAASEASALLLKTEEAKHAEIVKKAESRAAELEGELQKRSDEIISNNNERITVMVRELADLKEQVKEQVAQATGLGQFGAFQSRRNTISANKYWWVAAIGALVAIVVGLTYEIALHAQQGDLHSAAFWIKLSMNIPLGFLISFCTIQYSRERRLEEEYAFKASISISLTPYREMIYQILEKEGTTSDGSYTAFVIDSVRNVFTSPTEKIFDTPKRFDGVSEKSLKATAELIGTAVKAAK